MLLCYLQDSWFVQLYDKFCNERKHLLDDPEVVLRKKVKTGATGTRKSVPSKLRRGALNWEPPYPEGEDEDSIKRHKEALAVEWRRRNPDLEKIEQRMMLTFPERRRQMNRQIEIKELKADYPALFDFSQVEYTVIAKESNMIVHIKHVVDVYVFYFLSYFSFHKS